MKSKGLKRSAATLKKEFRKNIATYLLAGFGFVAGLAWNDAIKALIDILFPPDETGGLIAKFIYAGVITLFVVFITLVLGRILKTEDEEK